MGEIDVRQYLEAILGEKEKQLLVRFEMLERVTNAVQEAAQEAITKAEVATQRHFDAINGLQGQLKDQQGTFVTRNELNLRMDALTDKVTILTASDNKGQGQTEGIKWLWGAITTLIGAVIGAVASIKFK